jgi:anti-sigma regulatory factor (Ser/Thr protein kinase)
MSTESAAWALTIPSDLRLLALTRAFIEAVCHVAGLDHTKTHHVVLAVDEATNNVIRHAHRGNMASPILVQCFVHDKELEIRLHDEGEPFDLESLPALDPAELRPGGRGIFLIRHLMDQVSVLPRSPRGNILRLIKKLPVPDSPDSQTGVKF